MQWVRRRWRKRAREKERRVRKAKRGEREGEDGKMVPLYLSVSPPLASISLAFALIFFYECT